jgi:hypothetical protein
MIALRNITIGVLAAFELGVVWLVFNPDVSDRYRAYFIERSTDCWPGNPSGAVEPNQPLSFADAEVGDAVKDVLLCGWLGTEATGTWSQGPEARLLLQLKPGAFAKLEFNLLPFITDEHPRQRVSVTANDVPLEPLELTASSAPEITITVPASAIPEDGRVDLGFRLPDAVSLRELGISTDRRKLGIRLLSLTVRQ